MNEENNNYEIDLEQNNITAPEGTVIPGNIIADPEEEFSGPIIVDTNTPEEDEGVTGPMILNLNEENNNSEEIAGPIIINSEEEEKQAIEKINNKGLELTFKELENEIRDLTNEKQEVENNIESLNKRKNELEILIRSKQEELDYKREVEVTTDKLKTYIRDLEVKPGAVRDALAALINNMDN